MEITVKSQITGPVVRLSDDLFTVEKFTLKTSHHNFHPLGDFHWSKTSPHDLHLKNSGFEDKKPAGRRSQKIPEIYIEKKIRPNYQVG